MKTKIIIILSICLLLTGTIYNQAKPYNMLNQKLNIIPDSLMLNSFIINKLMNNHAKDGASCYQSGFNDGVKSQLQILGLKYYNKENFTRGNINEINNDVMFAKFPINDKGYIIINSSFYNISYYIYNYKYRINTSDYYISYYNTTNYNILYNISYNYYIYNVSENTNAHIIQNLSYLKIFVNTKTISNSK